MLPSSSASSTPSAPTKPIWNARIFTSGAREFASLVTSARVGSGATGRFVRIRMVPTLHRGRDIRRE